MRAGFAVIGLGIAMMAVSIVMGLYNQHQMETKIVQKDVVLSIYRHKLDRVCSAARSQVAQAQYWIDHDPGRATTGRMIVLALDGTIAACGNEDFTPEVP